MVLKSIMEEIKFVDRFKEICESYNDFDNRMEGHNKELCKKVLDALGVHYRFISNGSFYQIKDEEEGVLFQLNLVLKGGIVESLLYIYLEGKSIEPSGRLDFWPEDLEIPFDRLKYGLPKYGSEEELTSILAAIFSIYNDLKSKFVANLVNNKKHS